MKHFLLIPAFLLVILPSALARIGDTEAEATTRYGKPTESKDGYNARHKIRLYHFKDYTIMVEFMDDHSHSEYFTKDDKTSFSDTEANTILTASQFNSKWTNTWGNSTVGFYEYSLGTVLWARRDDNKCYLTIESLTFQKFREQSKAESEKNKLKGF